jgi:hypothetical protein
MIFCSPATGQQSTPSLSESPRSQKTGMILWVVCLTVVLADEITTQCAYPLHLGPIQQQFIHPSPSPAQPFAYEIARNDEDQDDEIQNRSQARPDITSRGHDTMADGDESRTFFQTILV